MKVLTHHRPSPAPGHGIDCQSPAPGCALDAHGVAPASEACSIGSLVAVFFPVGTLRPMIVGPPSLPDGNSCAKWFSL